MNVSGIIFDNISTTLSLIIQEDIAMKPIPTLSKSLALASLATLLALAGGCGRSVPASEAQFKKVAEKYGLAYDAKRAELKLLPLPKPSSAQDCGNGTIRWFCPDPTAVHVGKTIVCDSNGLASETDLLGKGMDRLTIVTTYADGGKSVAKQEASLESNGSSKAIPMAEAEKLLKEWKVR